MYLSINNSNVSMQGFRLRKYSTHTPQIKPFPEGYFMRKSPCAKDYVEPQTNKVAEIFKRFVNAIASIL